jgi:hypothetical protein
MWPVINASLELLDVKAGESLLSGSANYGPKPNFTRCYSDSRISWLGNQLILLDDVDLRGYLEEMAGHGSIN